MNDDEATIVRRWISVGDADAFRALFVRHSAMVYSTCRRILPTDGDAEEVSQECFEALAFATKPPARYLGPWLHRVATNLSLKRIRAESRRSGREKQYVRDRAIVSETVWNDVYPYVDKAVSNLPEKFRVAVVARYLEARTLESIAQELGVSPRTVAYRAEKGVALARRALGKRGITIGATSLSVAMGTNMAGATVIPESLTAALGKLAIAGSRGVTTNTLANTLGGIIIMKKAGITALVIVGALVAYWSVTRDPTDSPDQTAELSPPLRPVNQSSELERSADVDSREQDISADDFEELLDSEVGNPDMEGTDHNDSTIRLGAEFAENDMVAEDDAEGASLSGFVIDMDTRMGLEGVSVTAAIGSNELASQTDSVGHFKFDGLLPGDYTISSSVPLNYVMPVKDAGIQVFLDSGSENSGIEIPLQLGGTTEGVISFGGAPALLKGFELSHKMSVGAPYTEFVETDAIGAYTLSGLIPGGRTVHFRSTIAGRTNHKIPVIIESGKTTIVDVNFLAGTASIQGMVYQNRETPLVAQIEAHFLEQTYYTTSGEDGYYILEGLPAGQVQIVGFTRPRNDSDAPLQRRMFSLDLNEDEQLIQDIEFSDTAIVCSVTNIPESNFSAFFVALNGEVDLSNFNVGMLGMITRQRAAITEISADGTGALTNLEPGTYTILAISFPGDPAAMEALKGKALIDFIQNLAISNSELVTITEAGEALSLDLDFP